MRISDWSSDVCSSDLQSFVYASGTTMKPIFDAAKRAPKKRVAYSEGEEERVLRAAQIVVDEGIARPTLIGRPAIIAQRIETFGLRPKEERSEERRVGKGWFGTCSSRWQP